LKEYIIDVVLTDRFTVEAECKADAIAQAVRNALDVAPALYVDATVISPAEHFRQKLCPCDKCNPGGFKVL
jgi:hypothetical protein